MLTEGCDETLCEPLHRGGLQMRVKVVTGEPVADGLDEVASSEPAVGIGQVESTFLDDVP
ncbi:hypothetical protein GPA10_37435 [Streptomyces sp. p1417]|uniref:Uncharacterized protein n=1 Tax=Streptomyces typhae TaxID=2681492 RepID=A0A6L6X8V8_9ACTN|nr:hypothetical protein [Streptomyces typhae]MVO90284.1 hypothetical protein [Streptomyces typhae]